MLRKTSLWAQAAYDDAYLETCAARASGCFAARQDSRGDHPNAHAFRGVGLCVYDGQRLRSSRYRLL